MSYDEFVRILYECHIIDSATVAPESRLREDLSMSSFSLMVLIVKLEETLGLQIDPVALADSSTVRDLFSIVSALLPAAKQLEETHE